MGVPVGELQSTMAPTTDYCLSHAPIRRLGLRHIFFCHGQKRDNLIRASQRARGATKNVVKIGSVISEFKKRDCEIYASIGPQFEDSHSLRTLTFQNGLHYHNFDFSRLISSHFCTSHRNLARFS